MRRHLFWLTPELAMVWLLLAGVGRAETTDEAISAVIASHEYDLHQAGLKFLLDEAGRADYFLLGELHGDQQIPGLLERLWPELWRRGYRHVATETSAWAAHQLEFGSPTKGREIRGTWTSHEAARVHALAGLGGEVLWGCDMEELQPDFLIKALADLNPRDSSLARMVSMTGNGYSRKMAPLLLELATTVDSTHDATVNDVSLRESLLMSLRIETDRLGADGKMMAQIERERLMKKEFLTHYNRARTATNSPGKVLLRLGRNHLHRGYDARGVSTLGNFVAEFAEAHGETAFNVGAFGAGGSARLLGSTWNADERQDELAFALLAGRANYEATVFDLRPLRPLLHSIPRESRSALQNNLIYWADSYDALICYRMVTPLGP